MPLYILLLFLLFTDFPLRQSSNVFHFRFTSICLFSFHVSTIHFFSTRFYFLPIFFHSDCYVRISFALATFDDSVFVVIIVDVDAITILFYTFVWFYAVEITTLPYFPLCFKFYSILFFAFLSLFCIIQLLLPKLFADVAFVGMFTGTRHSLSHTYFFHIHRLLQNWFQTTNEADERKKKTLAKNKRTMRGEKTKKRIRFLLLLLFGRNDGNCEKTLE